MKNSNPMFWKNLKSAADFIEAAAPPQPPREIAQQATVADASAPLQSNYSRSKRKLIEKSFTFSWNDACDASSSSSERRRPSSSCASSCSCASSWRSFSSSSTCASSSPSCRDLVLVLVRILELNFFLRHKIQKTKNIKRQGTIKSKTRSHCPDNFFLKRFYSHPRR